VSPSRKLLRPGEGFPFRAVVMDAEGCTLAAKPAWSIAPGPLAGHATVDAGGVLSVGEDAGEGELGLVASIGGKGVTVRVEVTSPDKYDDLLAMRGLSPSGESDQAAVAVIATGTIGGRTAVAEDAARARKETFVAIVGALAAALGLGGFILLRRGRRRSPPSTEAAGDEPQGADEPPVEAAPAARPAARPRGKICPTCGEHYPNEAGFCGRDGTQLVLLN
jgi:hypothetical protein